MGPDLDANGYLDQHAKPLALSWTILDTDGATQTVFLASYLESSLYAFGEDELLDRVRQGISRRDVQRIGRRCAELEFTSDPASAAGSGYPKDEALATAAVEILGGAPRPLVRKRRRPGSASYRGAT